MTRRPAAFAAVLLLLVGLFAATAEAKPDKRKAREHFDQAEAFMNTSVFDEAIAEYKKAYKFAPDAHGFLFNIGLAYEKWDKPGDALSYYTRYLTKSPKGKKAAEATARKVAIERMLEKVKGDREAEERRKAAEAEAARLEAERKKQDDADNAKKTPKGSGDNKLSVDRSLEDPGDKNGDKNGDRRLDILPGIEKPAPVSPDPGRSLGKWAMIGIGAGLVAGGVILDLTPESSSNGSLDAMDIIPPALYAAGATLMLVGVF